MVKGGEADYIYLESKEFTGVTFDTTCSFIEQPDKDRSLSHLPEEWNYGVEEGSYHYKLRS